ncbi:MAG: biopolymer transporter ExbD [Verrucomicrobia bacterium]|nr:biopolymer transporter ExbD [Verrucomicrobiota bacterium]
MRRFSQRNSLVTLSDINITPLLDLAFVLLIIFVITTPLLEQGLQLSLPEGGKPDRQLRKEDIRTVEVSPQGVYTLGGRPMPLAQIEGELVRVHAVNPNMAVYIRADENAPWKHIFKVTEMLGNRGISQMSFRTKPAGAR